MKDVYSVVRYAAYAQKLKIAYWKAMAEARKRTFFTTFCFTDTLETTKEEDVKGMQVEGTPENQKTSEHCTAQVRKGFRNQSQNSMVSIMTVFDSQRACSAVHLL